MVESSLHGLEIGTRGVQNWFLPWFSEGRRVVDATNCLLCFVKILKPSKQGCEQRLPCSCFLEPKPDSNDSVAYVEEVLLCRSS